MILGTKALHFNIPFMEYDDKNDLQVNIVY